MARIADKHGLTNKYRPIGTGKRAVKRGRPRQYLFGPPSKSRKTHRKNYKSINYDFADIDVSACIPMALIVFFVVLIILFSIIPIFRCIIPVVVGAALLSIVEDKCKKAWGLPSGKWSKPLSIGWTILTAFTMIIEFFLVLLAQIGELPLFVAFIIIPVYVGLSFLILRRKRNNVKNNNQ